MCTVHAAAVHATAVQSSGMKSVCSAGDPHWPPTRPPCSMTRLGLFGFKDAADMIELLSK